MNARYVLLTAAKDEAACIGEVIQLVLRQTILPVAWFIMDDGSNDETVSIVERFAADHPFIRLQSARSRGGRNFGSQYKAIQAAYELARPLEFDFIGVQDADQAPETANYYDSILAEFNLNPKLGIAGGFLSERYQGAWQRRPGSSEDSVAGGSAMFRRKCFEQVGGYTPLFYGGSDWLIQLDAKMAGWEILVRPDLNLFHYRPTSSAGGVWRGAFREGLMDASFGSHPVFEFFKCCRRVTKRPFVFGGMVRFLGYVWWNFTLRKPLLRAETVNFLRKEQVAKLRKWTFSGGKLPVKQTNRSDVGHTHAT